MFKPSVQGKKQVTFWFNWKIQEGTKAFVAMALDTFTRKSIGSMLQEACGNGNYYDLYLEPFNPETYEAKGYATIRIDSIDGIQRPAEFDLKLCQFSVVAEQMKFDHQITTKDMLQPRVLSDVDGNFYATEDIVARTWKAPWPCIYLNTPGNKGDYCIRPLSALVNVTHFVVLGEINAVNRKMGQLREYMRCGTSRNTTNHMQQLRNQLQSNQVVVYGVDQRSKVIVPILSPQSYTQIDIQSVNHFLEKIGYETLKVVEFE